MWTRALRNLLIPTLQSSNVVSSGVRLCLTYTTLTMIPDRKASGWTTSKMPSNLALCQDVKGLGSKDDQERSKRPSKHLENVASRPAERQLVVRISPKSATRLSLLHADALLSVVRQSMSYLGNMGNTSRHVSKVDSGVDAGPLIAQVPQCFATSATHKSICKKATFDNVNTKVTLTI